MQQSIIDGLVCTYRALGSSGVEVALLDGGFQGLKRSDASRARHMVHLVRAAAADGTLDSHNSSKVAAEVELDMHLGKYDGAEDARPSASSSPTSWYSGTITSCCCSTCSMESKLDARSSCMQLRSSLIRIPSARSRNEKHDCESSWGYLAMHATNWRVRLRAAPT
eukprot:6213023-Pleurochrysis_carterae.AAC.1